VERVRNNFKVGFEERKKRLENIIIKFNKLVCTAFKLESFGGLSSHFMIITILVKFAHVYA
jgi:hypothetical protein